MDVLIFPSNGHKPHQKVDCYILPWRPSENQLNINPKNTKFDDKRLIVCNWSDKTGLNDMGSYASKMIENPPRTQTLSLGLISAKVLIKTKETAKVFRGMLPR